MKLFSVFYKQNTFFRNVLYKSIHYIQGQSPEPKVREYFYFIDHQGQLFLDDARIKNFTSCFKEKDFLVFFFKRLKINESDRYKEFPYLSPCGRERNFVRCDDKPIVYTHIIDTDGDGPDLLSYGGAGSAMTVTFEPEKVCMLPDTCRVYHPATPKLGGIGLIKSSVAIELSKHFDFQNGEYEPPTHFTWKDRRYELTNELFKFMKKSPIEMRDLLENESVV